MKIIKGVVLILLGLMANFQLIAQQANYILNGSATQNSCNCYTLTPASMTRSGSVWNKNKISLTQSFDFIFNVYLGCIDANGADGIVFMLQPISTSVGTTGSGLGFEGVNPSVGVTLDTWQNANYNDPEYDHIAIQINGILPHGRDLAGPVPVSSANANIEDCQWHTLRVVWDAATNKLSTYFDGNLRLETTNDLVANVFNNDPMVYWGFSAATGGSYNLQQFCTALNPSFSTNFAGNATCVGSPVEFRNASESFTAISSYHWDFGDNTTSADAAPAPHNYGAPGIYNVKLAITGFDGCLSDTLRRTITIGDYPVAAFSVSDTCEGLQPRIINTSSSLVGSISQWKWKADGVALPAGMTPDLKMMSSGSHDLSLTVTTTNGCTSPESVGSFELKPAPDVRALADDGCIGKPISFSGMQVDSQTTIANWNWTFGPGITSAQQNITHSFPIAGNYDVSLTAIAHNGCSSDPVTTSVFVNEAIAFAGNDTVLLKNEPFRLGATGGQYYNWTPVSDLQGATSANPVIIPQDDITYTVEVTTAEGCTDTDDIAITVFKGSGIYVPTGFTPNGDGTNDQLGAYYIGINHLAYFMIYNRWGELVFSTSDRSRQWDGTFKGKMQPAGSYIWRLSATDIVGKPYELKGNTTLIR